jgi:hypothetical protein
VAQAFKTDVFHAVGGAWRNLALLHMRLTGYPLHVVHQYSISRAEALDAARLVAHQSKSSLERIEGMSKKRSETLPYAAVVLEQLIESLDLKRIEISAYGVREGLLFEAMPPGVRRLDPLIEGCEALTARQGVADELGAALDAWLAPAFARLPPCSASATPSWPRPPAAWPTWARACTPTIAPTWCSSRCCARRSPARPTPSALPGRRRLRPPRHQLHPAGAGHRWSVCSRRPVSSEPGLSAPPSAWAVTCRAAAPRCWPGRDSSSTRATCF